MLEIMILAMELEVKMSEAVKIRMLEVGTSRALPKMAKAGDC